MKDSRFDLNDVTNRLKGAVMLPRRFMEEPLLLLLSSPPAIMSHLHVSPLVSKYSSPCWPIVDYQIIL